MCGKPGGLGVAKHQSGACPWRRGGEPEDGGRRPSLAVFSPLKQSKPCPTQRGLRRQMEGVQGSSMEQGC